KALRMMCRLLEVCDHAPRSLFVTGVRECGEHPIAGGATSDIFRASYQGQRVALKRLRMFHRGSDLRRVRSMFLREALVWKTLSHPHVLLFVGVDRDTFAPSLSMVLPWMEHGNAVRYLTNYGRTSVNKLLFETAQGLQYLHSENVIHGNLRGTNVLINREWRACITDFGLSAMSDVHAGNSPEQTRGLRWMAPELIDPGDQEFTPTFASDVYAFGCLCVELYTCQPLFPQLTDIGVMFKVMAGSRPERPVDTKPEMSDALWQLVTACWVKEPANRPTVDYI
ncbi:kinase-like domain-containing protein, partial [Mycena rosella]